MRYSKADYLLYAFVQKNNDLDVWIIDFPQLKAWFDPIETTFRQTVTKQLNKTKCRIVPIQMVKENVKCWQRLLTATT